MRAVVPTDDGTGQVEVVETPVPVPGPAEVLLEVHGAAMNRADLLHARGKYGQRAFQRSDRPNIAGMEVAGRIVQLGADVPGLSVGDAVMAMCAGAYAEYTAVDHRLLLSTPGGMDLAEAAALPMALLTEFDALVNLAGMRRGARVVITGATAGVGLVGVQLAKAMGAGYVIGTTRSQESAGLLRELGADAVANSVHELQGLLADDGADIVVDHVGGEVFEACVPLVRTGASLVSVGRLGGRTASVDLAQFSAKRARLIGTTWKTRQIHEIATVVAGVRDIALPLVDRGDVGPVVAQRIGFTDLPAGYEALAGHHRPGKIVAVLDRG
jgi:NADPH:quinone reductase-like Zn-dependent oxidoreductase